MTLVAETYILDLQGASPANEYLTFSLQLLIDIEFCAAENASYAESPWKVPRSWGWGSGTAVLKVVGG